MFQYYTPDFLRSFGVGTPNGSLWTIPVELEFYVILPFIFISFKRISLNLKLLVLLICSIIFNIFWTKYNTNSLMDKLIGVSFLPYLYAFLIGGLIYLNWSRLHKLFKGKFVYWIFGYIICCLGLNISPGYEIMKLSTLFANILLAGVTISAAFTCTKLNKVLKGNDISYGIYIYHMLVINVFVEQGLTQNFVYLLFIVILVLCISIFSWKYIESKALKFKNI